MSQEMLTGLASIIVLGIVSQWLAWRFHIPAILLLLIAGIAAGPITGILRPDSLFGELLFPLVSVSVAIILFEGGLSLQFRELREGGGAIRNLILIGIPITWVLASAGSYYIVGFDLRLSILLGAILVVTGPTVIIPLLRQVRPSPKVGSIVKWEGIINDPIGAVLAVLVLEVILIGSEESRISAMLIGAFKAGILGTLIGAAGAGVIVLMLKKYLVPDFLQNPMSLMIVMVVFSASNYIQHESGLLAVTVMGVALANQRFVSIKHILDFKENLRVILISSLFIILAARLSMEQLMLFETTNWLFVAFLIVLVRPLSVLLSTIGLDLKWNEKVFIGWMAPRGIVAAAVVSVFAVSLNSTGYDGAGGMVPLIFQVIIGTVAVYGLTAPLAARLLKVAQPDPQGLFFAGAQLCAREIARAVRDEGFRVALVDSNWSNVSAARKVGCTAKYADFLSENFLNEFPFEGLGRMLAMTPNDEVNTLAAVHFRDIFGRSNVYQLPPTKKENSGKKSGPEHMHGRYLFKKRANFDEICSRLNSGAVIKKTVIKENFNFESYKKMYGGSAIPLFIITENKKLNIITAEDEIEPGAGDKLISIVDEKDR
ncbi:MAG: hypothetical protein GF307_09255 [candidate division Zixibacteria bacterium]|nr:hypothetical protein [candidate division Zixibacteria bacterium]